MAELKWSWQAVVYWEAFQIVAHNFLIKQCRLKFNFMFFPHSSFNISLKIHFIHCIVEINLFLIMNFLTVSDIETPFPLKKKKKEEIFTFCKN